MPKMKCFTFKAKVYAEIEGYVYAEDRYEAIRLIEHNKWDDLDDTVIDEVADITDLEEEESEE